MRADARCRLGLVATDRDGSERLREPGDATALFQLFAVRNQ